VEPLAGTDLRVLRLGAVSLEALKAAGFTPHLA
jgi:L-threonylcarbamoyladenylate synthase